MEYKRLSKPWVKVHPELNSGSSLRPGVGVLATEIFPKILVASMRMHLMFIFIALFQMGKGKFFFHLRLREVEHELQTQTSLLKLIMEKLEIYTEETHVSLKPWSP